MEALGLSKKSPRVLKPKAMSRYHKSVKKAKALLIPFRGNEPVPSNIQMPAIPRAAK